MSLSQPILTLLSHFQAAFTTPTWQKMIVLLTGTLLARGRRTVAAALRQMGQEKTPHPSQISSSTQSSALVSTTTESMLARLVGRDVCAGGRHPGDRDR